MKPPAWFRAQLSAEGGRVLRRTITDDEAVAELTKQIIDNRADDPPFLHRLAADYARRQLKHWLASHRVSHGADDAGQVDLFPDIPRQLEVAPGRFVAQAVMTRKDWNAAVKQAETKANNASGHAEAIKRIADKVLPLLTNDDLTTAQVWGPQRRAAEGGA